MLEIASKKMIIAQQKRRAKEKFISQLWRFNQIHKNIDVENQRDKSLDNLHIVCNSFFSSLVTEKKL